MLTAIRAIIDKLRIAAWWMIAADADVIIPGEIPLNLLLSSEVIRRMDDAPLKLSEMMAILLQSTGLTSSRRGWSQAKPSKERVRAVLDFYGPGRFIKD